VIADWPYLYIPSSSKTCPFAAKTSSICGVNEKSLRTPALNDEGSTVTMASDCG
jgi:hypothetical protein